MEIDQYLEIVFKKKTKEMEEFKAGFKEGEDRTYREWEIAFGLWVLDKYTTPLNED